MKGSLRIVVVMALGMLTLAACGENGSGGSGNLEGVDWELTTLAGATGSGADAPPITARFEGETLSGSGGCNQYNATYSLDGGDLEIGPVAATRMACDDATNARETAYFAALDEVASYESTDTGLTLLDGDGADLLTYQKVEPAPLTGTAWTGLLYNDGNALLAPTSDAAFTATFADDGTVSGSSGCNTFSGSYTLDGNSLSFGPLASTQMACADDVMTQEAAVLGALGRVASFVIQGNELTLLAEDGSVQLSYEG
jgi:heat shock protein HslJ